MSVSGTSIGFLILLSKAGKVPIYYSPVAWNQARWPLFLFYFFNVLGLINNCAKFKQILITNSFSMESP